MIRERLYTDPLDELASRAYLEARLALLDQPGVRLFTRRGAPDHPRRTDLITVYAVWRRGRKVMAAAALVSTGNAEERGSLEHVARALRKIVRGEKMTGAEVYAAAPVRPEVLL